jgi:hypothetical protein
MFILPCKELVILKIVPIRNLHPMTNPAKLLLVSLPLAALLSGCHSSTSAPTAQDKAEQRAELEDERTQLQQVPPPVKSRFMAVHSFESWENPYITVQPNMVELHVTRGDANTTGIGTGGMFRPVAARREELNIGMDKLGEAISSIPSDAWPYGRVIAIEEAHKTPASAEPSVRRNMEVTVGKLSDLGVMVYDLNEGKLQ